MPEGSSSVSTPFLHEDSRERVTCTDDNFRQTLGKRAVTIRHGSCSVE